MNETLPKNAHFALEAVLLFHDGGLWDDGKRQAWGNLCNEILGNSKNEREATTRVLCDLVRVALGRKET